MDRSNAHKPGEIWRLARRQHGVVTRAQLLAAGLGPDGIDHRLSTARLHRLHRGVYAVGRPHLTRRGEWFAAVLSCGRGAVLSHESAAALLDIEDRERRIAVSVPLGRQPRRRELHLHRVVLRPGDTGTLDGIPLTSPARTLLDLATVADRGRLEAAVNAADRLGLTDLETMRRELHQRRGQGGVPMLRDVIDARTFRLTDSELERRFLRLVRDAGLPLPQTGARVNGFKVDFFWRDAGLVVETDGLRYHRTSAQQERDRLRDQAHTAAGFTTLRFTHSQVAREPRRVASLLRQVLRPPPC